MIMSTKPIRSAAANCIDLSAAALHIIAMALMLMDHLWATLLPAQDWLTCAGRSLSLLLWQWKATFIPEI